MRPRTFLLAAAATLVLAACGGGEEVLLDQDDAATPSGDADDADQADEAVDGADDDGDAGVSVETEDGDVNVTEDEEGRARVESDDGEFEVGAGALPEEWPQELTLPDVPDVEVGLATALETDGQLAMQAMLGFPGEMDDARTYLEGLEEAGFAVELDDDPEAPLPRIDAEVDGNGWAGTITVQEGPNIVVEYDLVRQ